MDPALLIISWLLGISVFVAIGALFIKENAWDLAALISVSLFWPIAAPLVIAVGVGILLAKGLKRGWAFLVEVGEEEAAFEGRMEGRCHYPAPKPPR